MFNSFPRSVFRHHTFCAQQHTDLLRAYIQYTHNIRTIYAQYTHNIRTIYPQYTHNIRTIYAQDTHIYTIYTQYTHNIHTIYTTFTCIPKQNAIRIHDKERKNFTSNAICDSTVFSGGVQIPCDRSPWINKFCVLASMCVGPQYGIRFTSPLRRLEFQKTPK